MARHIGTKTIDADLALELELNNVDPGLADGRSIGAVRSGTDPALARALGLDDWTSGEEALTALLAGRRADGTPIPGAVTRAPGRSLSGALGLAASRMPERDEIGRILSGSKADGTGPLDQPASAARRLLALYGVPRNREATADEIAAVSAGRRCNGQPIDEARFLRELSHRPERISYLDLQFHPDKSVSVAAALASGAERAIIVAAHAAAADDAMERLAPLLGQMRRGDGGLHGRDAGQITWLRFRHYTARPTNVDRRGLAVAGFVGDPQLHEIYIVPNTTLTSDGTMGSLDVACVVARVHEWGALYQSCIARRLRQSGVEVAFHEKTGAARVAAVDDELRDLFSKRTIDGTAKARSFVEGKGVAWAELSDAHRKRLIKQGVQGDPAAARSDDVADPIEWRSRCGERSTPNIVADVTHRPEFGTREDRIAAATSIARELMEQGKAKTITLKTLAARALIATGSDGPGDVDEIAHRLAAGGIGPEGSADALLRMAAMGSAVLIEGGSEAYVTHVARVWRSSAEVGKPMPIAARTREEADLLAEAVRRETGTAHAPQTIVRASLDGADARSLRIAAGDLVRLGRPVNATDQEGGGGRIGGAGSVLRIVQIDQNGAFLQTSAGRVGYVKWASLYDREARAYRLEHAAIIVAPRVGGPSARIETALAGSSSLAPGALHPDSQLLLNRDLEDADGGTDEEIWRMVAARIMGDGWKDLAETMRECHLAADLLGRKAALVRERGLSLVRPLRRARLGALIASAIKHIEPVIEALRSEHAIDEPLGRLRAASARVTAPAVAAAAIHRATVSRMVSKAALHLLPIIGSLGRDDGTAASKSVADTAAKERWAELTRHLRRSRDAMSLLRQKATLLNEHGLGSARAIRRARLGGLVHAALPRIGGAAAKRQAAEPIPVDIQGRLLRRELSDAKRSLDKATGRLRDATVGSVPLKPTATGWRRTLIHRMLHLAVGRMKPSLRQLEDLGSATHDSASQARSVLNRLKAASALQNATIAEVGGADIGIAPNGKTGDKRRVDRDRAKSAHATPSKTGVSPTPPRKVRPSNAPPANPMSPDQASSFGRSQAPTSNTKGSNRRSEDREKATAPSPPPKAPSATPRPFAKGERRSSKRKTRGSGRGM